MGPCAISIEGRASLSLGVGLDLQRLRMYVRVFSALRWFKAMFMNNVWCIICRVIRSTDGYVYLISWGLFLWQASSLPWVLQLVFNSLFEVLFYSHVLASLSVTGGSPVSSFPLGWLLRTMGTSTLCLGSRGLTLSDSVLVLVLFAQACFFIFLTNNLKKESHI